MSDPRQIPSEDLALYAMQALPAEEMAAVAAALRENPQAQQELAQIQGDLALLALSAEQQPAPAGAFERLQARMRESALNPEPMTTTAYDISSAPARRSKWATFTPWAIAAALAIACSILGYRVSSLNDALDGESRLVSQPGREGIARSAGARSPECAGCAARHANDQQDASRAHRPHRLSGGPRRAGHGGQPSPARACRQSL